MLHILAYAFSDALAHKYLMVLVSDNNEFVMNEKTDQPKKPHWILEHAIKVIVGAVILSIIGWIGVNYEEYLCQMVRIISPESALDWGC